MLWTPPRTRTPNFVHTQTLALHSPQSPQRKTRPRGPNILSVRSMTQAHRQYELNSGISTATMPQRHVNISQLECEAYLESRQLFTPMTPSALRPQEHGYDNITTEFRNETQMHRQYNRIVPQYLPTPKPDVSLPTPKPDGHLPKTVPEVSSLPPPLPKDLDVPLYQEQQHSPVGLGIFLPKDTKHEQTPTQTSFFDEWKFRMELTEWRCVFPQPIIPLHKPIESPETLSRYSRAPTESTVLTWRKITVPYLKTMMTLMMPKSFKGC